MANLSNSMYFRLLLASIFIISVSAQCQPYNLETTQVSSTQLSLSWECFDRYAINELQVTYRLTNRGQCDTGDGSQDPPFDIQTTQWGTWSRQITATTFVYDHSATLYNLLPYSTYSVSVRAREPDDDGDGYYSPGNPRHIDPNPTTSEAAPSALPTIESTAYAEQTSLSFVWGEIPCEQRNGNIIYSYETRNQNNQLVSDATYSLTSTIVSVSNLLCDNTYKVRVVANQTTYSQYGTGTTCCSTRGAAPVVNFQSSDTSIFQRRYTWTAPTYSGCPSPSGTLQYDVSFVGVSRLTGCSLQIHEVTDRTSNLYYDIYSLQPFYSYTFTVEAVGGTDSSDTWFTTQPAQRVYPSNIRLTASTTTSLTISWDEIPCNSRNGNIQGYSYELSSSNGVRIRTGEVVLTSTIITGLERDTTYAFRVAARIEAGTGTMSNKVNFQTMAISISAPTDITAVMILKTSLTFAWSAVTCTGTCSGPITGYAWRLLLNNAIVDSDYTGANMGRVTISELIPCTVYTFDVAGMTASETGIYGTVQQETAGDVDMLSIVPQSSTELAVSWTVPSDSCTTNAVYTVEYRLINQDQCLELDNSEVQYGIVSETSAALTNLRPYSTYEVSVKVETSVETQSATTEGSTPTGGPYNLTAVATYSSITFTWSEPPCGQRNGVIAGYTYSFIEGSRAKRAVNVEDETTTDMMVTFTDLDIYTEYTFTIAANTDDGKGVETTLTHRTPAGVPSAPTKLKETTTADSKPGIQWSAPDMPNGEIIEYNIRYWSSDDLLLTAAVEGKTLMYTLPDILKTNTTYNFQVRAKTSAGEGPWSDAITVFIAPVSPSGPVNQSGTFDPLGPIIGGVVAVILVGVVLIALICYYRRNKTSTKETPKETEKDENEIYDEIDAKKEMMAKQQQQQQRLQTLETGYEVNMAMETKMSPRAPSDGSAYEDVNIKKESEYQGLDLDAVNEEQSYQDLRGNTVGDKSAPQYAHV